MTPAAAVLLVESETGVFRPIVLPKTTWPVKVTQIQRVERRTIRQQAVCSDRLRLDRLVAQEALQESERCLCIPPAPDHKAQDFAFLVDRPPKVHPLAADSEMDFTIMHPRQQLTPILPETF
jgi:hypothetical protein